jgi:hypothetical protein
VRSAFAFDRDGAALLDGEALADRSAALGGELNAAGLAVRLHARSRVHRVAPQIVAVLGGADDSGDGGAGVKADAQIAPGMEAGDGFAHVERHGGGGDA